MTTPVLVIDELGEQECRRLLGTRPIGRLGFTERALPRILPVHYTVRGDEVVVGTLSGVKVSAASRGDVLAFEVDDYDPSTREGWCVGVVGPCRLLTDPGAVAEMDALGFTPFTPAQDRYYIAIPVTVIHGRRLHRQQPDAARNGADATADRHAPLLGHALSSS